MNISETGDAAMLRKTAILALCMAATLIACEKKEPAGAGGPRIVRREARSPSGMAPIQGMKSVFISERPLTVGEYLTYLRGTGQPVPTRWRTVGTESPEAALPVTGVDRKHAEWCATWHLKRLPTLQEWRRAGAVVGPRPYPWTEEGDAAGTEVLLVQEGTPDAEAKAVRDALPEVILADYREQVAQLQGELRNAAETERRQRDDQWKRIKPAFFSLVDQERTLAGERARRESIQMALQMFARLALDKGELAVILKMAELTQEDAKQRIEKYRERVGSLRADVQRVRDELQKETQAAQDEVLKLTKAFEDSGLSEAAGGLAEVEAALAAAGDVQSVTQAVAAEGAMRAALQQLAEAGPAFTSIPGADELKARAEKIAAELAALSAEETPDAMGEVQQKLDRFGEVIGEDFLQEKLLAQQLAELVELRSRKKTVEAGLAVLKAAMP